MRSFALGVRGGFQEWNGLRMSGFGCSGLALYDMDMVNCK
jgi:hypothetical protein